MEESVNTMNYEFFLDKDEHRSYLLLEYLENSPDLSDSLLKIQDKLLLSTFIIKKTFEKIQEDVNEWGISKHLSLTMDGTHIKLNSDGRYSSKFLLAKYISKSLYFKLLLEIFKNEYVSLENFAEKNHLSYSSAYTILQNLKSNLKKYRIFFDKKKLYGDNMNITLFYLQLFLISDIDVDITYIFPNKIIKISKDITKKISKRYLLSEYEKKEFIYYLSLFNLNINKGITYINESVINFFSRRKIFQIKKWLNILSDELAYIIVIWLYTKGKLKDTYINSNINGQINDLNRKFIIYFEKNIGIIPESYKEKLEKKLRIIHFKILYFTFDKFKDISIDISFFRQTYPDFYFFLLEYTNLISNKYKEVEESKIILFFDYFMLLINSIPLKLLQSPIKILVDFSYGEYYNEFIKKNVSFLSNLNIEIIEAGKEENPDVILTNLSNLYKSSSSQVIVWRDPPRVVDWGNLAKLILEIQENRYSKHD